jgi:hypothetical protein
MSNLSQLRAAATLIEVGKQVARYTDLSSEAPTPYTAALNIANIYGVARTPAWARRAAGRYESSGAPSDWSRATSEVVRAASSEAIRREFAVRTLEMGAHLAAGAKAAAANTLVVQPILTWFNPDAKNEIPIISPVVKFVENLPNWNPLGPDPDPEPEPPKPDDLWESYLSAYEGAARREYPEDFASYWYNRSEFDGLFVSDRLAIIAHLNKRLIDRGDDYYLEEVQGSDRPPWDYPVDETPPTIMPLEIARIPYDELTEFLESRREWGDTWSVDPSGSVTLTFRNGVKLLGVNEMSTQDFNNAFNYYSNWINPHKTT